MSELATSHPSSLPRPLCGIVPPIVTPLSPSQNLDLPALRRVIERVLRGRVHGVFVLGSTGESPSLSMDLRRILIEETCSMVRGRAPVLVNVSETALTHSFQLAEYAAKAGAAALVLSPPCYFPLHQQHLASYVRKFAASSPLPIFLYNVPQYAHNEFAPATVGELSHIPNIIGLKNSNGSLDYLGAVRAATAHRAGFNVLVGNEETLFHALLKGAHGGVCGGANMFPELFVELYEAVAGKRQSEAESLHQLVARLAEAVYTTGPSESSYLRGLKRALSLLYICDDVLAEPLQPFNEMERAQFQASFRPILELIQSRR